MNERTMQQTQVAGLKRLLEDAAFRRDDADVTPPNTPPYLAYRLLHALQRAVDTGYVTMTPEATSVRYRWHHDDDPDIVYDYLFPVALMDRLAPELSPEVLVGKIVAHWLRQIGKETTP